MKRYTITTTIIIFTLTLLLGSFLALSSAAGQMNASSDTSSSGPNVQGIWSVNLKGMQAVTIALHQNEGSLFGSAKSDTDMPWNAAVMGDISGNRMDLSMASFREKSLVLLRLMGTVDNESIRGTFVQTDDQGNAENGLFTAVLINPDLSAYNPAQIKSTEAPAVLANASTTVTQQTASQSSDSQTSATQSQPVTALGNPKYRDVHSLAGTVPESLGVGFIGDGTMGAGGASMG